MNVKRVAATDFCLLSRWTGISVVEIKVSSAKHERERRRSQQFHQDGQRPLFWPEFRHLFSLNILIALAIVFLNCLEGGESLTPG